MIGTLQKLSLSRMEIEEAGPDPQRLAEAILAQLGPVDRPHPDR